MDNLVCADIGLMGLAVMGENLVMNMESKGFTVAVFNRHTKKVTSFIEGRAKDKNIVGTFTLEELVAAVKKPRKIMLMIKAGTPVDDMIAQLMPLLDQGDIIIDGGNSNFHDTNRRTKLVEQKGLLFVGMGVSGGEEGALNGPSIMPGGSADAWPEIKGIFQGIAAKVEDGRPCCDWVGPDGAGHFVKTVHNGIEYGDMQLICEAYQLLRDGAGLSNDAMQQVFSEWNKGDLDSYLIEITADILAFKEEDGSPLVEKILDTAGQKGTGKWSTIAALDEGIPLTLIGEAVFARCLSALKEERVVAAGILGGNPDISNLTDRAAFIEDVRQSLFLSKLISYAQGFALLRSASKTYGWDLNYGDIALMWRGGCIIRSVFLNRIKLIYDTNPDISNILLSDFFSTKMKEGQQGWRRAVSFAIQNGIPVPALSAALSYYDGYRCANLPANLLQAQRDYFGAHTYERTDRPRGEFFHTNWTGEGGTTASTTYNV